MNDKIRLWVYTISVLFLTLYIPLIFIIYSPYFYDSQYERLDVYDRIDKQRAQNATTNLRSYFLYIEELDPNYWNEKEQIHMKDVRDIYSLIHFLAIFSLVFIKLSYSREYIRKAAAYSMIILGLMLILIVPTFTFFWNSIFHQIMFSNDYWIYTSQDISYYLFPEKFFVNAFLIISIFAIFVQIVLVKIGRKLMSS